MFMTFLKIHGQSWDVKISGNVTDMEKEQLSNIPVILFKNQDTIQVVRTNDKGEFIFISEFTFDNTYYITLDIENQRNKSYWVMLYEKGDSQRIFEYQIDLMKLRMFDERFDVSIYYELNETREYTNFNISYFKTILDEYPLLCVKFTQYINREEKLTVAKRRMKNFKKDLKLSEVNMKQIIFTVEIIKLEVSNSDDKRSRIDGVAYSMDGNCK